MPSPLPPNNAPLAILPSTGTPGANHKDGSGRGVGTGISFADGHAIFWKYSDERTGKMLQSAKEMPPVYATPNSPDAYQLEAWSGGPVPPNVAQ